MNEDRAFLRVELLLQVIADELYVARFDRSKEAKRPTSQWSTSGRSWMEENIEQIRGRIVNLPYE